MNEEDNGDNNETIAALGGGSRQESAEKDNSRHDDRTKEVVDGNACNNTMMQRWGAGSLRPRAGKQKTDSQNSGSK